MARPTPESTSEAPGAFQKMLNQKGRLVRYTRTIIPPLLEGDVNAGTVTTQGECYYDTRTGKYFGTNGEGPANFSSDLPRTAFRPIKNES